MAEQMYVEPGGDLVTLCALRAGEGRFGIDTREVREVLGAVAPQPVPLAPAYIAGAIAYRGEVLTTVSLRMALGLEPRVDAGCVLVLEDKETGEPFGLAVDSVEGTVTVAQRELEANPSTLDERSAAIFGGVFPGTSGLLVRLDPRRLRPAFLARGGTFAGTARPERRER